MNTARTQESTVVKMPKKPKAYSIADDVMNDLRMRLYDYDVHETAKFMDVSIGCVWAIRSGRTKWPRPKTFFALLSLLDIELRLYDRRHHTYL